MRVKYKGQLNNLIFNSGVAWILKAIFLYKAILISYMDISVGNKKKIAYNIQIAIQLITHSYHNL